MASKKPAPAPAPKAAAKSVAAPAPAPKEAPKEEKVPLSKMRGPRGVAETAKITLVAKTNPKREGSKAHAVFSCYEDGMTVGDFCDAVDATDNKGTATPNLVYDAKHGFIEIEGYDAGEIIQPKEKAPPKPKAEPKAPKGKPVEQKAAKAAVEEEAAEETVD